MGLFIQARDYGVTSRPLSNKKIRKTLTTRHRETGRPRLYQASRSSKRNKRDLDKNRKQETGYRAIDRNVDPVARPRYPDQTPNSTGNRPKTQGLAID